MTTDSDGLHEFNSSIDQEHRVGHIPSTDHEEAKQGLMYLLGRNAFVFVGSRAIAAVKMMEGMPQEGLDLENTERILRAAARRAIATSRSYLRIVAKEKDKTSTEQ